MQKSELSMQKRVLNSLFCTRAEILTLPHAYACELRKCLILKSVKSNSLIHKIDIGPDH